MKSKEKFSGQKTLRCILVTENKKSLGQVDFLACTFTFRDPFRAKSHHCKIVALKC